MRRTVFTGLLMGLMLNLVAGPAESSPRRPAPVVAAAIQQQASEVCHEVRVAFFDTGPGRLIARKAGEVSRLAGFFLRMPTCCNHSRTRLYVREMKDLVDEMEDLTDSLRRRRPPVGTSRHIRFGTRGFEVFIGETATASCGGCGRCDCCRRLRQLRQAIECLENLVRELDQATRRCPCCGRLRTYDPPAHRATALPPRSIPHPPVQPDLGYWPGPKVDEDIVRWQRMAQLWLSLALD